MRLVEFQGDSSRLPVSVVKALRSKLGNMQRVGGNKRVYQVGDDHLAVVYVLGNTTKAVGIAWSRSTSAIGVTTIYMWDAFDVSRSPDYALDIPVTGSFDNMVDSIAEWIKNPRTGSIAISEEVELDEMARRSTSAEFMQMAQAEYGDGSAKLTMPQMMDLARKNDVQIPGDIRAGTTYKVDAHHWNLSGRSEGEPDQTNTQLGAALGAPIEDPSAANMDPAYQDALALAKAKTVRKLASQGKVYLMGRKVNGAFFRIPGLEELSAQLERMLSRQLQDMGAGGKRESMEEQYEMLHDKVKLVAGGESNFLKSLLITGAPSSGKTFTVMKTIKEIGLSEGKDYVVKKGRITTPALYRTLIEQIDGMVIFDDCDSVVDDKNAINMLKGALDTDPVREISYDVRGTINTAVMEPAQRDEYVSKISRILRGKPEGGDLETFERLVSKGKDEEYDLEDFDDTDDSEEVGKYRYSQTQLAKTQQYLSNHFPNKIDFRGRIIFISNMAEDEWDSAIITRAFSINMDFSSSEMLDYIDKIKVHIKTPGLTDEEKQEVVDYLRELYATGKLKRQINFRLVQQCFDLRLTANWRKLMSML